MSLGQTKTDNSEINLHTDLQEYPFDDHDLLPGVDAEGGELRVVGQRPHRPDEVLALLGGLLRLASQKQAAGRHNLSENFSSTLFAFWHLKFDAPYSTTRVSAYIFGEVLEVVEHVEPVEVDGARRHRVVRESQRLPQLQDKPVVGLDYII